MKNCTNLWVKIIIASFLLYFIIWLIFLMNGPFYAGNGLDKRDWLSFLSGFLSLVGTIIISMVIIMQNRRYQEMDIERLRFQNMPNLKFYKLDLYSKLNYMTVTNLMEKTLNPDHKKILIESKLSDTELVAVIDNCPLIVCENGKLFIRGEESNQRIIPIKAVNLLAIYSAENYGIGSAINVEIEVKEKLEGKGEKYDYGGKHLKEGEKVYFEINLESLFSEKNKEIIIEFTFCDIFGNKYYQKSVFTIMSIRDTKYEFSLKQKDREPIYVK